MPDLSAALSLSELSGLHSQPVVHLTHMRRRPHGPERLLVFDPGRDRSRQSDLVTVDRHDDVPGVEDRVAHEGVADFFKSPLGQTYSKMRGEAMNDVLPVLQGVASAARAPYRSTKYSPWYAMRCCTAMPPPSAAIRSMLRSLIVSA